MWGKKTRLIVQLRDQLSEKHHELERTEDAYLRKRQNNESLQRQNTSLQMRLEERTAALKDMTEARSHAVLGRSSAERKLEEAEELHEQLLQDQFDAMQVRLNTLTDDVEHWKGRLLEANRMTDNMTTYYGPLVEKIRNLLRPAEAWWNESNAPYPWGEDDAVQ